jgi:hypothetical protein
MKKIDDISIIDCASLGCRFCYFSLALEKNIKTCGAPSRYIGNAIMDCQYECHSQCCFLCESENCIVIRLLERPDELKLLVFRKKYDGMNKNDKKNKHK